MDGIELLVLAVGLSMDAVAAAVGRGLACERVRLRDCAAAGLWFGGFQAIMPVIGYTAGVRFREYAESLDHWIVFVLLLAIGVTMIRESGSEKTGGSGAGAMGAAAMLPLALATSADALAVGISFAFLHTDIVYASAVIGAVTFVLSALALRLGCAFGAKYRGAAERAGGAVLILLGIKILLEHLCLPGVL